MLKQIRNNVELILNERIEARQKEFAKTNHGERQINFGYMKVEISQEMAYFSHSSNLQEGGSIGVVEELVFTINKTPQRDV
jgi:hypothetical protein